MKILAIRLARLGDVILLLPALTHLKTSFPDARLTLLTGVPCAPLAELCPAIDEVMAIDRVAMRDGSLLAAMSRGAALVRDVRKQRFDLVIDFHSFRETNLLAWLSRAPRRLGMKRMHGAYLGFCFNEPPELEDKTLHVSDMFMRLAGRFSDRPLPAGHILRIPADVRRWLGECLKPGCYISLYVDAPTMDRVWPAESFAAVADYAVERLGSDVLVLAGNGGESLVQRVLAASRRSTHLRCFSRLSLPQLAGVIASSRMLVSNDTGPMHFGPALGVPTIGLFSVGLPEHFRPRGPKDLFIQGNPIERIEIGSVVGALQSVWTTLDPDSQYLFSESEGTSNPGR